MTRASHRRERASAAHRPALPPDPPASRNGRLRNLLALALVGLILVGVAAWVRLRVSRNPMLRIPPVETSDLLPAVARELEERQTAILEAPDSAAAWGEYGLVLLAHGFRKEAGDCFMEAEALDPADYRWSYYLGMTMGVWDAEVSLHAFERAVQKEPTRLALRLRLAEWLFDLRQLESCQHHVHLALEQDPNSARAQLLQARLCFQRGDTRESLEWARRAVSTPQGNRSDVHELLAQIYQRLGDADAAAAEIEKAQLLPPGVTVWDDPEMGFGAMFLRDASLLNTLAELSRARGDSEGYILRLRQIVTSEPSNVIAKQKLGAALVEEKQYDEAQKFLDWALTDHPDSADLLYLRGQVHQARGERDQARQLFERAIQIKPDYDSAYQALGRLHILSGDTEAAIAALREATRLSPNSAESQRLLAQALTMAKQYTAAAEALRQAVALNPADDALRRALIDALRAAGRDAEAVRQVEEAIRQAKDPQPFQEMLQQLQLPAAEPAAGDDQPQDERTN